MPVGTQAQFANYCRKIRDRWYAYGKHLYAQDQLNVQNTPEQHMLIQIKKNQIYC